MKVTKMNELEQYLTNFSLYVDVWTDDEGLYVHDWDTDECLSFAHDVDFEEVRETVVKHRHGHIMEVCRQEEEGTYVF